MRFITEFELNEYTNDAGYLANKKYERGMNLGKLIADTFGWDETHQPTCTLAVEAFPIEKWIEFKNKLLFEIQESAIHGIPISPIRTLELIKDLEFYSNKKQAVDTLIGKPSGDAITNQQL